MAGYKALFIKMDNEKAGKIIQAFVILWGFVVIYQVILKIIEQLR